MGYTDAQSQDIANFSLEEDGNNNGLSPEDAAIEEERKRLEEEIKIIEAMIAEKLRLEAEIQEIQALIASQNNNNTTAATTTAATNITTSNASNNVNHNYNNSQHNSYTTTTSNNSKPTIVTKSKNTNAYLNNIQNKKKTFGNKAPVIKSIGTRTSVTKETHKVFQPEHSDYSWPPKKPGATGVKPYVQVGSKPAAETPRAPSSNDNTGTNSNTTTTTTTPVVYSSSTKTKSSNHYLNNINKNQNKWRNNSSNNNSNKKTPARNKSWDSSSRQPSSAATTKSWGSSSSHQPATTKSWGSSSSHQPATTKSWGGNNKATSQPAATTKSWGVNNKSQPAATTKTWGVNNSNSNKTPAATTKTWGISNNRTSSSSSQPATKNQGNNRFGNFWQNKNKKNHAMDTTSSSNSTATTVSTTTSVDNDSDNSLDNNVSHHSYEKPKQRPSLRKRPSFIITNDFECAGCKNARGGPELGYIEVLDLKYHLDCLKCASCGLKMDATREFSYVVDKKTGNPQPVHHHCYADMHGIKCIVCNSTIQRNPITKKIQFLRTPFWDDEKICMHHKGKVRQCTSCRRYEPQMGFPDVSDDRKRCVCPSCNRNVTYDNTVAESMWKNEILPFYQQKLKIPVPDDMWDIPIRIVNEAELESHMTISKLYVPTDEGMARGICVSQADSEEDGSDAHIGVKKICCLSGLPRDLALSVLAHEGTHAWIKLHPKYNPRRKNPHQVEEGCCQLVAYLFLTEGLKPIGDGEPEDDDDDGPTDEELREYFQSSIKDDEDVIYGDGFRIAYSIYKSIGLPKLLNYIVENRKFPPSKSRSSRLISGLPAVVLDQ